MVPKKQISGDVSRWCIRPAGRGTTHGGQVLLGQSLVLPAQLDDLAHLVGHPLVVELLRLAVQLGRVSGHEVLLVLTRRPCW